MAVVGKALVGQAVVGSAIAISAALADAWLNTLRGVAYSAPALYVELHTGSPGAAGTANASSGSTSRVVAALGAAASGSLSLTNSPTWTNGGVAETITHISAWTAASGGTFLFMGTLLTPVAWTSGDAFTLGTLTASLSPLAA